MTLEMKRTELLTKYQPTYALVQEVDKEIADAKASIVTEESRPIRAETTDRNPTYSWINEELAKAKADYSGLQARAAATQAIVSNYEAKARGPGPKRNCPAGPAAHHEDRRGKLSHVPAQARGSAHDERAGSDPHPQCCHSGAAHCPYASLEFAVDGAGRGRDACSHGQPGTAFALDYMDTSFRTPAEVLSELNVPVLGTVSLKQSGFQDSWNGNGNGGGEVISRGERVARV